MLRVLLFIVLIALAGLGITWIMDRPGEIVLTWQGYQVQTSVAVGLGVIAIAAIALTIVWSLLRFIFKVPSLMAFASRARRRNKGYAALSQGMIAASAGDVRRARRGAAEASRHLPGEPLALLLRAQAAQLAGDRATTETIFAEMAAQPQTRLLGLRGLHVEAQRRGDMVAAHRFAQEAHGIEPLPWSGKAVLDHRAGQGDWASALAVVNSNIAARLIDKPTGERQRAVLETALAMDKEVMAPDAALALARTALKRAPDLVPARAVTARLLGRRGDIRKAAKLIERAWPRTPHPELADIYVDLRPGNSNTDRLHRAQTLARTAQDAAESRLTVARAALAARDFKTARQVMVPLFTGDERPTARMCLMMAEIEETEFGATGAVREWLSRASRAPRDEMWIADGIAATRWAPVSPTTGRLDAFVWQRPVERLAADVAAEPQLPLPVAEPVLQPPAPAEPVPDLPPEPVAEAAAVAVPEALVVAEPAPPPAPEPVAEVLAAPVAQPAKGRRRAPANAAATPVIFPLAAAPDDPGPEPEAAPASREITPTA